MGYTSSQVEKETHCYHCGDKCSAHPVIAEGHAFCCDGCRLVYELLSENGLCTYYSLEKNPGIKQEEEKHDGIYSALDDPAIRQKLIQFENGNISRVIFRVPVMHCTSCIYLLENLHRIHSPVISSRVNFLRKEVTIDFDNAKTTLGEVARHLSAIGYPPSLNLLDSEKGKKKSWFDNRVIKIGVAGFCFGNIMMLSFPEYLSHGELNTTPQLRTFFALLSLLLSLPVLLYSASGFFVSAWKAIRSRTLNIDAPIALAIAVTFLRSVYEISFAHGSGYLDSMSGIVFFMLLGRFFQDRKHDDLVFDRDYRSYFPIAVDVIVNGKEKASPVTSLRKGDEIIIRGGELVPTDALLLSDTTLIDYSFVSGESEPVKVRKGEKIFAGARQAAGSARYTVEKETSQSYLTQLWNNDAFSREREKSSGAYIDRINKWFSSAVFLVAFSSALLWLFIQPTNALNVMTAVLIVVCPCTLLLASTFTNGNILRWLGKEKFYLKNPGVIERIAGADTIIFDKTGTITTSDNKAEYVGERLSEEEQIGFRSLAAQSGHPFSRKIAGYFANADRLPMKEVRETEGKGITGVLNGKTYLIGSALFAGKNGSLHDASESWIAVDGKVKGRFIFSHQQRPGLHDVIREMSGKKEIHLLSGDNDSQRKQLEKYFGERMHFNYSPEQKLNYIKRLRSSGKKVIMIGDGLNDAGALMEADAGIALSDNMNSYFPACDAILSGEKFRELPTLLSFTSVANKVVTASFIVSVLYNICGIYFAVTGQMSPLVAAILMPASSFSMILLTTIAVRIAAFRRINKSFRT
ncbi:MAG TPA: heavy metal translocating P-type ATPase metal-binding domain-containing protein [Bacteroidia bacterium]|jgi:Cu+-exporting ATPase|nr:heavy metal translocating P-type ATPase metal-binding domain-containing protein [Bacteroidia bacterium]